MLGADKNTGTATSALLTSKSSNSKRDFLHENTPLATPRDPLGQGFTEFLQSNMRGWMHGWMWQGGESTVGMWQRRGEHGS